MPDTISNKMVSDRRSGQETIFPRSLDAAKYTGSFVKYTDSFLVKKCLLDYALTSMLLIILAIPLAVIAIAIKLDSPGPVFFRQSRVGFRNQSFMIWEFRTMRHETADIEGSWLALRNDPRITRFGALLRKWSLDEVPQLFNVLAGDMSLVGPRPHPIRAKAGDRLYSDAVPNYAARHAVKPGITGWPEINCWRVGTIVPYQIKQRVVFCTGCVLKRSIRFHLWIIISTVRARN